MKYTIKFTDTDQQRKAEKAIKAAQDYLGERFDQIIKLFTESIENGEITTRKQLHFAMSFAGIHGYPVDALIKRYWSTLPA